MSVQSRTSNSSSSSSSSSSNNQITTDFDIFGVGDSISTSNYVYDGQTVLLVNSSASQTSSSVQGYYFDPTIAKNGWNITSGGNLGPSVTTPALLDTDYYSMQNFIPDGSSITTYNMDLLNGSLTSTSLTNGVTINGTEYDNTNVSTTTMALLGSGNFYGTQNGVFINGAPSVINPNYPSGTDSASYMFTANYYYPQTNDIVMVYMVYTIVGTSTLNGSSSSNVAPTVSVVIYNRVISKEDISRGNRLGKVYTMGPINLSYTSSDFNYETASYGLNYNVPVIIADNCTKINATLSLTYVPANYYLNQASQTDSSGLFIAGVAGSSSNNTIVDVNEGIVQTNGTSATTFGHFVAGLTYPSGTSLTYGGAYTYCNLIIKSIWNSPISIYNTYSSYSISDMGSKTVVLLFGKSSNGATFLVTNSGTAISSISNYAVTSLNNFITLMNSVIAFYDPSVSSLSSYFTDSNVVSTNNISQNTNAVPVQLQPLLSGSIINPDSVTNSPNMYYMLLQTNNSANLSIDPTSQVIFNNDIGNYFDLQNSSLCSTGRVNYSNSIMNILTASGSYLFGNSIYSGETTINNQNFYNLIILPEAQFNGVPLSNAGNLSIYGVSNSPFYTSSSSTSSSSSVLDSSSKLTMTVSNIDIV